MLGVIARSMLVLLLTRLFPPGRFPSRPTDRAAFFRGEQTEFAARVDSISPEYALISMPD
jgi:hypothetical protein